MGERMEKSQLMKKGVVGRPKKMGKDQIRKETGELHLSKDLTRDKTS